SFVLEALRAQASLPLAASARAPIEDRNRHAYRGQNPQVVVKQIRSQRLRIKPAVYREIELRESLRARGPGLLFRGAALRVKLRNLRPRRNRGFYESVYLGRFRQRAAQVDSLDRRPKIVSDQNAQRAGGNRLCDASLFPLVAARCHLHARASDVNLRH